MKLKIMAAALALLMLFSACSRNKSNYKYNIPGYTGNTEYSADEEEQSGYVEYAYDEAWAENNVFEDGDLFYLDELSPEEMLAGMLAEIEGTPDPTLPAE